MVRRAVSTTDTVHADITLTRFNVKVKVAGILNFRKLAKPCMHACWRPWPSAPFRGFLWSHFYFIVKE